MTKSNRNMLESAQAGYLGKPEDGLFSSPCWLAHKAGQALAKHGVTMPVAARMSRGFSVRIETQGGTEFIVRFAGDDLSHVSISRA